MQPSKSQSRCRSIRHPQSTPIYASERNELDRDLDRSEFTDPGCFQKLPETIMDNVGWVSPQVKVFYVFTKRIPAPCRALE